MTVSPRGSTHRRAAWLSDPSRQRPMRYADDDAASRFVRRFLDGIVIGGSVVLVAAFMAALTVWRFSL